MPSFPELRAGYDGLLSRMKVLPGREAALAAIAARRNRDRAIYMRVSTKTNGVPWELIAALHDRESGGDFRGCLHNGENIIGTGRKTKLVPAGRGPFATWEESAIDALMMPPHSLHLVGPGNWTPARVAYEAERFNGFGYMNHPQWDENSPYVWGWTNIYDGHGKYVSDGHYDPEAEEKQCGVMPLYLKLCGVTPAVAPSPDIEPAPKPAPQPWWAALIQAIARIFKRK
jgi:Uncharacterized conserved protein